MDRSRRPEIRRLAAAFAVAVLGTWIAAGAADAGGEMCRLRDAKGTAPSHAVLAEARPGLQALVVSGTVYAPDGETPAAGVTMYVYQTDETGRYAERGAKAPRIRGWMTTDAQGRYEYRTFRPAPYPGSSVPAHVHVQLWGSGYWPQWGTTLKFADDPLLPERERSRSAEAGRFAWVCAPAVEIDGSQRCRHDLRLSTEMGSFEEVTRHGFDS